MKARFVSVILGTIGFLGMFAGALRPPSYAEVGLDLQESGLGGLVFMGILASPYLLYIFLVRRRVWVAVSVAIAMYVPTAMIFQRAWNSSSSTAALGFYWFPLVLYPMAALGGFIDQRSQGA